MKVTPRTLFLTFIYSVISGIAVNSIYYFVVEKSKGYDYSHVLKLIVQAVLYLNILSVIMSLPALFLNYPAIGANKWMRLLLYFAGPVLLLGTVILGQMNPADKTVYLFTLIIFLFVHIVFYYRASKNEPPLNLPR